ncbi:GNAT family N-acetyltransferase [Blastococcus xanthinilyticus]|uniref:L-amino acid N-acyltransferase YncA n=1 Tax=Blastococcus xanthinilyticus TaxID=1564164 RepID=A0A5S5CMW5_9ACTN|nr:GNAT family N-acetyltransferase [Blastococcus xanthinilyticus]TYP83725.1 L-amino acid N-acyltransferase YncA [Blastococcus xanthinilyticus]
MTSDLPFPRRVGSADVSVRPARPEDAVDIARVQGTTWRTAYRDVLPAGVLDAWDEAAVEASWRSAVGAPPSPGHRVLVAVERETVVGFAAFAAEAGTVEVATLLVEPRWGRRGHGSRLLAAVTDLASAGGQRRLEIWLAESDRVSAGFFESAGWEPDGWARTLDTGEEPLRELRWHTTLDGNDPDEKDLDGTEEDRRS